MSNYVNLMPELNSRINHFGYYCELSVDNERIEKNEYNSSVGKIVYRYPDGEPTAVFVIYSNTYADSNTEDKEHVINQEIISRHSDFYSLLKDFKIKIGTLSFTKLGLDSFLYSPNNH